MLLFALSAGCQSLWPFSGRDPLVRAYADCTSTRTVSGTDGEPLGTVVDTYDENGDAVLSEGTFADPDLPAWTSTITYGAPHEAATWTRTYHGRAVEGYDDGSEAYEWADGDLVHWTEDEGDDGSVDLEAWQVHEDHRIVHWEFDLDGDGVVDDTADWSWTAGEDDGWSVLVAGDDANGPYTITETRDEELRILTNAYSDAVGIDWDTTYSGWSEVDEYTTASDEIRLDGVLIELASATQEIDELGRLVHREELVDDVDADMQSTLTTDVTWSCPD